jgi:hypothetical protein
MRENKILWPRCIMHRIVSKTYVGYYVNRANEAYITLLWATNLVLIPITPHTVRAPKRTNIYRA